MAEVADRAVGQGQIDVSPPWHKGEWHRWMEGTKGSDWCVSRQLWWGHQIPAYRLTASAGASPEEERWVVGRDLIEAEAKATALYGVKGESWEGLLQDEDVLVRSSLGSPHPHLILTSSHPRLILA